MTCQVCGAAVFNKYALVNFSIEGFTGEAIAFPIKFTDVGSSLISANDFKNMLSNGKDINVLWSKKLNRYVVKF